MVTGPAPAFVTLGQVYGATVPPQPGVTFTWTLTNGTLLSGAGTASIQFQATGPGAVSLACEAQDGAGISSGPGTAFLCQAVAVPPAPALVGLPPASLAGETAGATLGVAPIPGCTFDWSGTTGATFASGAAGAVLAFTPGAYGSVDVVCKAVNEAGTRGPALALSIPIAPRSIHVPGTFLVAPYLQLGPAPSPTSLELMWMTGDTAPAGPFQVEVLGATGWSPASAPVRATRVATGGSGELPHRVYAAGLSALPAGGRFTYRVSAGGHVVFQETATALKQPGQAQRIAVVGDLFTGAHDARSRLLARRIQTFAPDLMVLPGDMVNLEGRARDYRNHFFPGLNADPGSPGGGATLLRSCVLAGCLGNNDTERLFEYRAGSLPLTPSANALAYYYYFSAPLNGPAIQVNASGAHPHDYLTPLIQPAIHGAPDGFLAASGAKYPRMGNYSFDSGNVHWTVLDSCLYMEWAYSHVTAPPGPGSTHPSTAPRSAAAKARLDAVKVWLANDLAAAATRSEIRWRFVVFHHPAFNLGVGARGYFETWMRQIWPLLQDGRVDLAFCGHVHCYQRSRPMRYAGYVPGMTDSAERSFLNNMANLQEDTAFAGTGPAHGVIQILTGAGGANPRHFALPAPGVLPYPACIRSCPPHPGRGYGDSGHESFSLLDLDGDALHFRQIGVDGSVVDEFRLTH